MKKRKKTQKKKRIESIKTHIDKISQDDVITIAWCMQCKMHIIFPKNFEIPPAGQRRCLDCGSYHVQFYTGKTSKFNLREALKGGNYKMAENAKKKSAGARPTKAKKAKKVSEKKPKTAKAAKVKKPKEAGEKKKRGYSDEVKQKVIDYAKNGKSVNEIVKAMGADGPKTKAVVRFIKAAGIKDVKRK